MTEAGDILLVFGRFASPADLLKQPPLTHPPLGICSLAAFLSAHGISANLIDLQLDSEELLFELAGRTRRRVVGFSVNTFTFPACLTLARRLKEQYPELRIVFGGPTVELHRDELQAGVIDALVIGEGEQTLHQLLAAWEQHPSAPLAEVPGLAYWDGRQVVTTAPRSDLLPLDELPLPQREPALLARYRARGFNRVPIATSRGCPHRCRFCLVGSLGHPCRQRSIEHVMREVELIREHFGYYHALQFVDETLNLGARRLEQLVAALAPLGLRWMGSFRAERSLSPELLRAAQASGLMKLDLGIESGSQAVLDQMDKGIELAHVERLLGAASELGLLCAGFFMLPHTVDDPDSLQTTLRVMEDWSRRYLLVPWVIHTNVHPRSALARSTPPRLQTDEWHQLLATDLLDKDTIATALRHAQGITSQALARHGMAILRSQMSRRTIAPHR